MLLRRLGQLGCYLGDQADGLLEAEGLGHQMVEHRLVALDFGLLLEVEATRLALQVDRIGVCCFWKPEDDERSVCARITLTPPTTRRSLMRSDRVELAWTARSLPDVRAALGDGLDEALLAEKGDGAAGGGAGYFPGVDDLGLGGDARALGVLAGFDA